MMQPAGRRPVSFQLLAWFLFAAALSAAPPVAIPLGTLQTTKAVHELDEDSAQKHYPVHLKSVLVLYHNPEHEQMFVHDSTGGLFLAMKGQPRADGVRAGDLVEVTGFSGKGR